MVWHWCYLNQCDVTQKLVIIFVYGKFSEMVAGTKTRQSSLSYGHNIMMEVGVHFM